MKRSINQETKETSGGFVDIAGINENWTLDSWGFKPLGKDGSGNPVLFFNFKNGPINVRYVEWDIDAANEIKNNKNTNLSDEEVVQRAINSSNGRIKQILGCFVPKESIVIDADSYEELGKSVVATLDKSANKEEKLRMKAIYGKNGYLEISVRNGRFIQLAKDPIGDMKISDWESDKLKKEGADSNATVSNASETGTQRKGEF
jgi:hypothetical protein